VSFAQYWADLTPEERGVVFRVLGDGRDGAGQKGPGDTSGRLEARLAACKELQDIRLPPRVNSPAGSGPSRGSPDLGPGLIAEPAGAS
jgi:hypothetical protein